MSSTPLCSCTRQGTALRVHFGGAWRLGGRRPDTASLFAALAQPGVDSVTFDCAPGLDWDSSLLTVLVRLVEQARARKLRLDLDTLPQGLHRLVDLAFAVPPRPGARRDSGHSGFVAAFGAALLEFPRHVRNYVEFLGEVAWSFGRFVRGGADMRARDLWTAMQECGVESLPIISLTNVLFGLILAFVGAVQLTQFGAQVYVAGLVGIGVTRVMGAIMVGVVMAGRVGAAYAALIGTMQVNEEVDALQTLGLSPIDFLVLPRVLALTLMIPFLTLYADLMGLLGGFAVGITMLGLNPLEYYTATLQMVPLKHVFIGLAYATSFGVIIALSGCYQGIRCGRSAAAVGQATTAAVVTSIVGIIMATAVITILCNTVGI